MTTTGDIRQLAGLLEGEGSFSLKRGGLIIRLGMSDLDVIDQARVWLGHHEPTSFGKPGRITAYRTKNGGTMYHISMCGARAAGWMMTLYCLMGQRRRRQIRSALGHWLSRPVAWNMRTRCVHGHPFAADRIKNSGCRECNKARCRAAYQKRKSQRLLRVV